MIPNLLYWIEFRRVGWQPRYPHQPGWALSHQASHGGPMDAPAIEHQQERTTHVAVEQTQKGQQVGRTDVVRVEAEIEPQVLALWWASERAADREAVMAVPALLDRGLAARCPSASPGRL